MIEKWDESGTFTIKTNPVWMLTGRLRWVTRESAHPCENMPRPHLVLQQELSNLYAGSKWVDVPVIEEPEPIG